MDKLKEVVNDPARLEEELRKAFDKMDPEKKGYISHEVLKTSLIEQAKALGLPKPEKEPTEAEKEAARKLADPDGSGKITFENFKKLMHAGIKKARDAGKL